MKCNVGDITILDILSELLRAVLISFSISIIIFIFLFANTFVDKTKIEKLRKTDEKRYYNYILKRKLANRGIYTCTIIGITIVFISLIFNIDVISRTTDTASPIDIENWTSLILELGLGGYIALAIFTYENLQKEKSKKLQTKKQEYGLKKITLLVSLAKEEFQDKEYDSAKDTFNNILSTLTIFSGAFEQSETQQILELAEIGKIFCKYKGEHPTHPNRTMPFTTSVPANQVALFQKFNEVLSHISKNSSIEP